MIFKHSNQKLVQNLLRLATFTLFTGRAWQHLYWDAPFRALLWDKDAMESLVLYFRGGTWQEYVTSAGTDNFIQTTIICFGIFYVFMAILTLIIQKPSKFFSWFYILSSLALAFLAFLYCKEKFYHAGQFFEYSIQFLLPLFFYYNMAGKISEARLFLFLKIVIALTFTAHGLYAIGYYPQPGVFVDMLINILPISETNAKQILIVAGILDFVISIGIFIPRLAKYALFYAAIWGGLTALARVWANFYLAFPIDSLHQNLHETLYRLPHMLVPLATFFILISWKNSGTSKVKVKQNNTGAIDILVI
jgi:hypothetical protein